MSGLLYKAVDRGLCSCGCGEPAPIARRSSSRQGVRRGDQLRYISGHNSRRAPDLTRFVVTDTGCHEWTGPRNRKGYGRIQVNRCHRNAHAVAWEQVHGPVPEGYHVDHRCWNRACIHVAHLRLRSPAGNNRAKRLVKITVEQASAIRGSTRSATELARIYGVSRQYVSDIRRGRRMVPEQYALLAGAMESVVGPLDQLPVPAWVDQSGGAE